MHGVSQTMKKERKSAVFTVLLFGVQGLPTLWFLGRSPPIKIPDSCGLSATTIVTIIIIIDIIVIIVIITTIKTIKILDGCGLTVYKQTKLKPLLYFELHRTQNIVATNQLF